MTMYSKSLTNKAMYYKAAQYMIINQLIDSLQPSAAE